MLDRRAGLRVTGQRDHGRMARRNHARRGGIFSGQGNITEHAALAVQIPLARLIEGLDHILDAVPVARSDVIQRRMPCPPGKNHRTGFRLNRADRKAGEVPAMHDADLLFREAAPCRQDVAVVIDKAVGADIRLDRRGGRDKAVSLARPRGTEAALVV